MDVVVVRSYQEMSLRAAEIVCESVRAKTDLVLALPTGATPVGMYRQLVEINGRSEVDFSRVRTFNLDEYLGLAPEHPASYHAFMQEHFFSHVNLSPQNTRIPQGLAPDVAEECRAYESAIAEAGNLDLAVLGIGQNGHVGFNEPATDLQASVHVAQLSEETRRLAFEFWAEADESLFRTLVDFPERAITMGMATILKAEQILLLASGASKAQAVCQAITGTLTSRLPASLLQLHRQVTLIVDEEAASLL